MLSLNNVCKSYPQSKKKGTSSLILNNLSTEFSTSRTCIVGPNGTGKSTLLLIVAGLLAQDSGLLTWQSRKIGLNQRKRLAALASDSLAIPGFLTARQALQLIQDIWKKDWPTQLIERFFFCDHLDQTVDNLSTGNLKKLQLISALIRQPEILLLDEPNIALDQKSLQALWQIIEAYPHTIVVASNEPPLYEAAGFAVCPIHIA